MKKFLVVLLAAILCVAMLSSCGSTQSSAPKPAESPAETQVVAETEAPTEAPAIAETEAPTEAQANAETAAPASDGLDFGEYSADNPLVLKYAIAGADIETNVPNTYGHRLKDALEKASGGAIVVDLYPGGILCSSELQTIEAVIGGTVDMGINNTSTYSNYVPEYSVFDLPFLLESNDHAKKFMQSEDGERFIGMMEENNTNVTVLSLIYMGPKNLGTVRPIESLKDMNGLVLKTSDGKWLMKAFTAWGASPQTMAASEIVPSLSQGIIEGQENTTPILNEGGEEFCHYMTKTGHVRQFTTVNINTKKYRGLTEDMQNLIKKTAQDVSSEMYDWALQLGEDQEEILVSKGVTVYDIEQTEWMDALSDVYSEYFDEVGSEWYDTIKAIK